MATFLLLALLARDRPARAQPPEQPENDPRVAEAQRACLSGDVTTGVRLLAELHAATNDPRWLFNQGRCYEQNRQPEAAIDRFRAFLREGGDADVELRQQATAHIQALRPAPVELPGLATAKTAASSSSTTAPPDKGLRLAAGVLGILGVAAVTTGVVLSVKVNALAAEIQRNGNAEALQEPMEASRPFTTGRSLARLQWPAYLAGAGLLAGAAICFVRGTAPTPNQPAPKLTVAATGLGGAFGVRF
jgi:hypothetical protein